MKDYIRLKSFVLSVGSALLLAAGSAASAEDLAYTWTATNVDAGKRINWTDIVWTGSDGNTYTWDQMNTDGVCNAKLTAGYLGSVQENGVTVSSEYTLNDFVINYGTNRFFYLTGSTIDTKLNIGTLTATNNSAAKKSSFRKMDLNITTLNSIAGAVDFGTLANGYGCTLSIPDWHLSNLKIGTWNLSQGSAAPRDLQFIWANNAEVTGLINGTQDASRNSYISLVN